MTPRTALPAPEAVEGALVDLHQDLLALALRERREADEQAQGAGENDPIACISNGKALSLRRAAELVRLHVGLADPLLCARIAQRAHQAGLFSEEELLAESRRLVPDGSEVRIKGHEGWFPVRGRNKFGWVFVHTSPGMAGITPPASLLGLRRPVQPRL